MTLVMTHNLIRIYVTIYIFVFGSARVMMSYLLKYTPLSQFSNAKIQIAQGGIYIIHIYRYTLQLRQGRDTTHT